MKLSVKILSAWVAVELLALPFAIPALAGFKSALKTQPQTHVKAIPMPSPQGSQIFLIVANTPFIVISEGRAVDLTLSLTQSGFASGVEYGKHAQLPGDAQTCSRPADLAPARIYTAVNPTAKSWYQGQSGAIKLTVTHGEGDAPALSIVPKAQAATARIPLGFAC